MLIYHLFLHETNESENCCVVVTKRGLSGKNHYCRPFLFRGDLIIRTNSTTNK